MIKTYLKHILSKEPHHRRQHAVQVAGVLTALAFVVWVTTLPLRFAGTGTVAGDPLNGSDNQTMLAGAAGRDYANQMGVEVVGTSTDTGASGTTEFSNY